MLIFGVIESKKLTPVVVIDYTRTDDHFTEKEIKKHTASLLADKYNLKNKVQIQPAKIYSLDYSATLTHSGMTFGDSKRTQLECSIINAPNELVGIVQVKKVIKSSNEDSFADELSKLLLPEVAAPFGLMIAKTPSGKIIEKRFVVYASPYEPDQRRLVNKLTIYGGEYDDIIIRSQEPVRILKSKGLIQQLKGQVRNKKFQLKVTIKKGKKAGNKFFRGLSDIYPSVDKLYPFTQLNQLLQLICEDNKLSFGEEDGVITFYCYEGYAEPPKIDRGNYLTFSNSIPRSKMIAGFNLSNYVTADITCELFDVQLFETITVYDDSNTSTKDSSLFFNMNKAGVKDGFNFYKFYVMSYSIIDNRNNTLLKITASNNWLLSYSTKLDGIMEGKIYTEVGQ